MCLTALFISTQYFEHKRSQTQKDKKPDPFIRAIIVTSFLASFAALLEFVGLLDQGTMKEHWYWFPIIFICVVGVYYYVSKTREPLDLFAQEKIVRKVLNHFYSTTDYRDKAPISFLNLYKLTAESTSDLRSDVANWVVTAKAAREIKTEFFIQINVYQGTVLHVQEKPPQVLMDNLLGKKTPEKTYESPFMREFANETNEQRKNPDNLR